METQGIRAGLPECIFVFWRDIDQRRDLVLDDKRM